MIVLVNPNIIAHVNDLFTTGIPFMPVTLAYAAASLQQSNERVTVIDAFGEAPKKVRRMEEWVVQGLTPVEVLKRVPPQVEAFVFYAGVLASHISLLDHVRAAKAAHPKIPSIILENTQAVTAYALEPVKDQFFSAGADYVLTGESEERLPALLRSIRESSCSLPDGVWTLTQGSHPLGPIKTIDTLPYPAWTLFPLKNYWDLGYSHGPVSAPFLPLLTSRGCPYPCRFCVVPSTNKRVWRPRSPQSVVDEMIYWGEKLGIQEFHWEDLNPTIQDRRMRDISELIVSRGLHVRWKLAAGTKLETLTDPETVAWMGRAGCRYLSFSPESGSPAILKAIDKPFDFAHAERMVGVMKRSGIRTQACYVLGFPSETDADRRLTWNTVKRLVRQGLDEIALFIITPVPGSAIFNDLKGYTSLSELNFSPAWRSDFAALNGFRLRLYSAFLFWKLLYNPWRLLRQPFLFLTRRFETKMEMTPYRAWCLRWRVWKASR